MEIEVRQRHIHVLESLGLVGERLLLLGQLLLDVVVDRVFVLTGLGSDEVVLLYYFVGGLLLAVLRHGRKIGALLELLVEFLGQHFLDFLVGIHSQEVLALLHLLRGELILQVELDDFGVFRQSR